MRFPNRRWITRAFRLDSRDRAHALRATAWLAAAGLTVRVVPFSTLMRWIERVPPRRNAHLSLTPAECAIAMARASRVLPAERCLARAIAAACLLRRGGYVPSLKVGVALDPRRQLDAHAWLECSGVVITGGDVSARYAALGRLESGGA